LRFRAEIDSLACPMEDEKPSTKHLVLKPKEIVPIDRLARPGDGTAISVQLIHQQNLVGEQKAAIRRKTGLPFPSASAGSAPPLASIFKPKEIAVTDLPAHPGDEEAIHVAEILSENRVAEEQSGWGRLKGRMRRKSKRNRDFLLTVGSIDLALVAMMVWAPGPTTIIFGLSGIVMVTTLMAWMMFMVMDDY
jgi:hypothetical protein